MARRSRATVVAMAVAISFGTLGGAALAHNTHTVNNWYHGLGDGKDNDDYLHPFNHHNHGHNALTRIYFYRSSTLVRFVECQSCSHLHVAGYDTSPTRECVYESAHEVYRSTDTLNFNFHRHHSPC